MKILVIIGSEKELIEDQLSVLCPTGDITFTGVAPQTLKEFGMTKAIWSERRCGDCGAELKERGSEQRRLCKKCQRRRQREKR